MSTEELATVLGLGELGVAVDGRLSGWPDADPRAALGLARALAAVPWTAEGADLVRCIDGLVGLDVHGRAAQPLRRLAAAANYRVDFANRPDGQGGVQFCARLRTAEDARARRLAREQLLIPL